MLTVQCDICKKQGKVSGGKEDLSFGEFMSTSQVIEILKVFREDNIIQVIKNSLITSGWSMRENWFCLNCVNEIKGKLWGHYVGEAKKIVPEIFEKIVGGDE